MSDAPRPIREWHDVDRATFRDEVVTRYQPAVLKGLVGKWPAVARAMQSADALCRYLDACVVAGRRRFTLFPPDQIANLYVGPLDYAPTGTPVSLVTVGDPDLARFPRFRQALAAAQVAELDPGDAIYIPTLWWHHVESLSKHNMLVNYWWKGSPDAPSTADSALDCLLHCLLNFNHAAPEHRQAWRALFGQFVFNATQDPVAHIPGHKRGVLGEISPDLAKEVRAFLIGKLNRSGDPY